MNRTIEIEGFWERLDQAVNESGKTKTEIAKTCGFDRKSFYRRQGMPHAGFIARFCAETAVSADWLLGLERRKT